MVTINSSLAFLVEVEIVLLVVGLILDVLRVFCLLFVKSIGKFCSGIPLMAAIGYGINTAIWRVSLRIR